MPSSKNPVLTVLPGPGRLPASTISASAFIVPGGGGAGALAALTAHITDPVDAHMAGAIGIPPVYPLTTEPLLSSNVPPGIIDGESVLDFIVQAKDLFPDKPNTLGTQRVGVPNTGLPYWDLDNPALVQLGAWTSGGSAVFSHFILSAGASFASGYEAITYPADRGVLAVYRSTDGNYLNPGTTTLYAALWLGPTTLRPALLTCPSANFNQALRTTVQPSYGPTYVGLDQIELSDRVGVLKDYSGSGTGFADYDVTFFVYQIARHIVTFPATVAGSNDSWFLVHWRESYAVSDASIAPAALAGNLTASNCYSDVTGAFDTMPVDTQGLPSLNRRYVFRDALSAALPAVASWTATPAGTTGILSGVAHYNDATTLAWNSDLRINNLVADAWLPGTVAGPELPADFVTATDPVEYDFSSFGGGTLARKYYQLRQTGAGATYTIASAPLPADQVQDLSPGLVVAGALTPYTPTGGAAALSVTMRRPFVNNGATQSTLYLFNSWDATGGAGTQGGYDMEVTEKFVDESYRYENAHAPAAADPIKPVGAGVAYNSATVLVANDAKLQVIGGRLVYPQTSFAAGYSPVGPNYSTLPAGDIATPYRRYTRVFNTGVARNTGKLRIRGIAAAAFQVDQQYTGVETSGHTTGGAIIQVKVPGLTGWLDVGRALGDPGVATIDYYGCATGLLVSGSDVIVSFQTTAYTGNNGSGDYPLFVRVTYLNSAAGRLLSLDELEWLIP